MLNKFKQTQAQWGGSSDVIDHWLETRQALIVEYCKLAKLKPSSNTSGLSKLPSSEELQDFSQHLVDYISEGHFKIYDMVVDKWQNTGFKTNKDIDQAYAKIVMTTEPLLSFTDHYADTNSETNLDNLDDDLSNLGEIIEVRFEKEDHLIQLIADSLAIPPGA
ncbi:sigma D regulator [Vibrio sp. FNV 38]|nr:sigma D regulator [Vibrio sp. FNV 38]